ncbi:hypothetical protein [Faecalicatena contorta]|uniref:hypothetical protein n=1 Tax=Faecalicatena contorta TaxID=39482 RepID=UPI001F247695|nr:hypothetical protein [Faecalicatena contorta]MCF2684347.1 hypothetical protein [Faecalicatena contorta]
MNRRILLMLIGVSLATTGITGCGQKEEQNVTPAKGERKNHVGGDCYVLRVFRTNVSE